MKHPRVSVLAVPTLIAGVALAVLGGCTVQEEAGFPDVARVVEQRSGLQIVWNQGGDRAAPQSPAPGDLPEDSAWRRRTWCRPAH